MGAVMIEKMISINIDRSAVSAAVANGWERGASDESLIGWALVIAGESVMDGKSSGPVYLGNDGGCESPQVGMWTAY